MSEREFENYLVLLSRLLRLSRAQRDAIGVELRDHLEERLDVLTARGMSREDAVRMALEEFGDTASLAGEFSEIARNRKRRWMMRVTTGTIAVTAATILLAMALWPDPQAAPAPQRATAQQPIAAEEATAETAKTLSADDRIPTEAELNAASAEKLARLSSMQFVDRPLNIELVTIGSQSGVQFYLDSKALDNLGVGSETPMSNHLKNVPLNLRRAMSRSATPRKSKRGRSLNPDASLWKDCPRSPNKQRRRW